MDARWLPVVLVSIACLPVAVGIAWLMTRWRTRQGAPRTTALRRSITEVGIVLGTLPSLWMILTPLPEAGLVHLIPFEDLASQLEHPPGWVFTQVVGNLLVFAAFGFLAPIRWPIGPPWVVVAAAVFSATVEILQWALALGRVASVDDVLLNTVGAGLAALCSRRWSAGTRGRPGPEQ